VRATALALVAAAGLAAACDDGFGPIRWEATPDTATLYSLARPELLGLPSAYDFVNLLPVRVESPGATGQWDVALTEEAGTLALLPAGAVGTLPARAGIAVMRGRPFEAVDRAPGDTAAYERRRPVPVETGVVYVVRTAPRISSGCTYFAKVQPLVVDAVAGLFRFVVVRNPLCNDRALVPPEDD